MRENIINYLQNKNAIMFITALVFMLGIMSYFNDCGIICAAIITLAAIFVLLKRYISYKYILFWIFVFYFGFFNSYCRIKNSDILLEKTPQDTVITGQIVTIPTGNSPEKIKFFFDVTKLGNDSVSGKTLVTLTDEAEKNFENFNIGDTYKIKGKLRTPFRASNPSQFDYGKYLRNFKTYTVFYADKTDCVEINTKLSPKWKFLQELNNVRNRIIKTHSQFLKSPNLEILGGIVFGDDAVAPPDYIKSSFVNSGLLHILAASGMNVAFIYGFWYFILRRLKVPYKLTVISGMAVIILYTLMTGLGPSVIRAALMLLFILVGKLIDRDAHSVALLALVATLMLIYNPAYINDVGFQLSFLVTFGLLTTANVVFARLKDTKIPEWLSGAVLIPIIAQIWVAPIQMFYFNTFSLYSVFANISIMPFLSVISFGGFVSSVLAIFQPIANFICQIFDFFLKFLLDILVFISNFFSTLPLSLLTTTHPSILQILIYYAIILILTYSIKSGFSKKTLGTTSILAFVLILLMINPPSKDFEVIAFDVQNADAFLLKSPQNKYFIIDTGKAAYKGGSSQAKVIISKYLKDRGIKDIEGLVITHFDNDHSGGAVDLMNDLRIKKVYINTWHNKSYTSYNIYKTIREKKIPAHLAQNNENFYSEGDFSLTNFKANSKSDNENSIITFAKYKDFEMLFMGDAGVEAFRQVQKDIPQKIEVLKVGHHGAKGVVDRKMLESITPEISIISTGRNSFGHPRRGTLDVLRNTRIYRTDMNNSIKITSDGDSYSVYTYDRQKHKYSLDIKNSVEEQKK